VPLYITFCLTCTENNHAFLKAIEILKDTYRDNLCVITLDCMAACDYETSVMLEDDYYRSITPHDLCQQVYERLEGCPDAAAMPA
jgi:NADH:ubiquinone oxidoreductase subunit E